VAPGKDIASGKPLWNFNLGPKTVDANTDISTYQFIIMDCEGALEDGISILPTEIAISKFSLKDGETSHFHYFVDPGHLPLWYLILDHPATRAKPADAFFIFHAQSY
jgi:hypothetical protein